MSRSAVYGYDQRCEIFGSDGLVSINNVHQNTTVISNRNGVHKARLQHSFPERFNEAFSLELGAFADVVLHKREWPITASQCINVHRVTDAARRSAEIGAVVQVETLHSDAERTI
jgi:myo-inositol 2-dehydrogenase / D-chiro-inositol 1-dehydrogenase